MQNRSRTSTGFTLVEILIVVVILGILAAIVIPQFTNASESAKGSSLVSQLQTIRGQLELYQTQHNGNYPTLAQLWGNMTSYTDVAGAAQATKDATHIYGPYLQQAPVNPLENSSTTASAAAAGVGWVYTAATGAITANAKQAKATALNLATTDVSTY